MSDLHPEVKDVWTANDSGIDYMVYEVKISIWFDIWRLQHDDMETINFIRLIQISNLDQNTYIPQVDEKYILQMFKYKCNITDYKWIGKDEQ